MKSLMKCCTPGCPKGATGEDGHHCAEHQHERCAHPVKVRQFETGATRDLETANARAYAAAAELLDKCKATSVGRAVEHGGVVTEWAHGAELLRWFLRAKYGVDVPVVAADYGLIMDLWKTVRIAVGETAREDHYLDGSNYKALSWGVLQAEKE